jgi:hypothetical protein
MPLELVNVFGCAHSTPAAAVAVNSKENFIVISPPSYPCESELTIIALACAGGGIFTSPRSNTKLVTTLTLAIACFSIQRLSPSVPVESSGEAGEGLQASGGALFRYHQGCMFADIRLKYPKAESRYFVAPLARRADDEADCGGDAICHYRSRICELRAGFLPP